MCCSVLQLGQAFPALSHLSLCKSLHVEWVKPPKVTKASIQRAAAKARADAESIRAIDGVIQALKLQRRRRRSEAAAAGRSPAADDYADGEGASSEASDSVAENERVDDMMGADAAEAGDGSSEGVAAVAATGSGFRRYGPPKQLPAHRTSAAGWAALIDGLPHGLFSLDVRFNTLTYESFALLREGVSELRAGRVLSPEVEAARVAAAHLSAKKSGAGGGGGGSPGSEGEDEGGG